MQRSRGDEHGCMAAEEMALLRRERELMAQLHELLFPSPAPSGSGGASSSGLHYVAADMAGEDECSPVKVPAVSCDGRRRRSGSKRSVRDVEQDGEELGGGGASAKPARCRRRKQGATTLVTAVPDFDGYQWRKYGQKHIEAANHPRSYYRCTNSTDQGCPAKRTVQRNDDDGGDGGPPKYTVVYISEHTCKTTESAVAPVILETTVDRAKNPAASTHYVNNVPAAESSTTSTTGSGRTSESPANSDVTWSGGDTLPSEQCGDYYSHVFGADDGWDVPTAASALQQEMDFAGPIRSPVHIYAAEEYGNWSTYGLFVNDLSAVLPSSCHLFGF